MTILLLNFLAGMLVSFLGSLPVGILNVTVIKLSRQQGLLPAFHFSLASAGVESGYSWMAVSMLHTLTEWGAYTFPLHLTAIGLLLVTGVYYLNRKPSAGASDKYPGAFYLGLGLTLINMAAIPFWLFYSALLQLHQWISLENAAQTAGYVIGIGAGTILGLMTFALTGRWLDRYVARENQWLNRTTGLLLLATGLVEIVFLFT